MTREQFIRHTQDCQKALRSYLTALCCGNAALADDLAQDTFLKAYTALDTLGDDSKFKAWIFRIAHNMFISETRSRKDCTGYDSVGEHPAAETADSAFRYQHLYIALGQLSEKERSAILLYYLQGYSTEEIADITSSNSNTVTQQLSRGRKHLREILTQP